MTNGTKVSIAMAVYNGERFIREQLESFLRQTRLPDELVVSDNASTDSTVEIVRDFANRAAFPVRLFVNDRNLGMSKNFERAIAECTGDIIFLSDCDDVWYPEKIALMEQTLVGSPRTALAICDADVVEERLEPAGIRLWRALGFRCGKRTREKLAQGGRFNRALPAFGCCVAFWARYRPLLLPLPDDYGHDTFIALIIMSSGVGGIALVPMALMAYRRHAKQTTRAILGMELGGRAPGFFAQRFAGRCERPLRALSPVIVRLESAHQWEHSDQRLVNAIVRHWRARCELPSERLARIPIILRELVTLRYFHFSSGVLTAAKDLFFVR